MQDLHLSTSFTKKGFSSDGESLIISGMANTNTKDRAGDVILASAWTTSNALANYMKNPIILAFHDHSRPIGKALSVTPTEFGLEIEVEISKAAGPIFELIKDGVLKTFSVGFRILDADYEESTGIFVIKDVELHETSVVSVPCNQDSTFTISKSLNAHDYGEFKKNYQPSAPSTPTDPLKQLAIELGIIKEY